MRFASLLLALAVLSSACDVDLLDDSVELIPTSIPGRPDMEVTLSSTSYGEGKVFSDRPFTYLLRVRNVGEIAAPADVQLSISDDWVQLDRGTGGFVECVGEFDVSCTGDLKPGEAAWLTFTGYFSEQKQRAFWAKAELLNEDGNAYNNRSIDDPKR